ncbi:MAG: DUF1631 family protein [Pseudomonadales bacterium]|nr:DUF1631 family protein [Pseudomonadales bacterium]
MQEVQDSLNKLKFASGKSLTRLVITALENARLQIEAQATRFVGAKAPPISEESPGIADRFMNNLYTYFDELTSLSIKDTEIEPDDYDSLSLVDHDYLEAMIAMEGMVKNLRELEVKGFKSLQTRLEAMYPSYRIDETTNPLDPEQVGDCFNEAIRPLGLKAHYLLSIYREFNKSVFQNYEEIIAEANDVLIENGILPNLDITAEERAKRKKSREAARAQLEEEQKLKEEEEKAELETRKSKKTRTPKTESVEEIDAAPAPQAAQQQAEIFAMMQTLVKSLAQNQGNTNALPVSGPVASNEIVADQQELRQQQEKLMGMLTDIQSNILQTPGSDNNGAVDASAIAQEISQSLETETASGEIAPISVQSSDVINLVTLLYEAIWKDQSLSVVMKELIGRTQISIMKVALSDTSFFDNEQHPTRLLLNELALAGIAWTATEDLDTDPLYNKVKELVERILGEAEIGLAFLQNILIELRQSVGEQTGTDATVEMRIREADDYKQSMDDIHTYVSQKVNERVLKGYLDPSIRSLLDTHIHDFLVKLVVKEGINGGSWKPVMSTIDVLLWTVQAEKQPGDRDRFERINPRLLDNLGKALEIGGASKTKITKIMRQLKQVQEYSFHKADVAVAEQSAGATNLSTDSAAPKRSMREPPPLSRDDPYLRQVDKLTVGSWLEFRGASGNAVRLTLASKIDSIDKIFFANNQGKKIIELTRMRLANELKIGSVTVVSKDALVNRAMDSVISNLKDSAANADVATV